MVRPLCLLLPFAAVCAAQAPDRGVVSVTAPDSGRRIALVIGNRAYPSHPLENSVNDAQDLGAVLKNQLNFQTTVKTDLKQEAFERSIEDFLGQVRPGDTALFYYAGHGMQIDGENLLLPTDFSAADDIAAKYRAYHVNQLRDRLRGRGARITIIVLDACRDNPFRTWRSESGGGLAGMGGAGAFIAFAADEGKTAQDNPGERNGLFTKYLLTALREPGLKIGDVFDRVRENVNRESNGRQTPFAYSGLIGTFRFREINAAVAAPVFDLDLERYNAVKDSRDAAQLEAVASELGRADLAGVLRDKARSLRSLAVAAPAAPTVSESSPGAGQTKVNPKDGLTYLQIQPGTFTMGCSPGDTECNGDEKPAHRVTITAGFWLAQTPVTVGAWKRYRAATGKPALNPTDTAGRKNLNEASGDDSVPAVAMTWDEAKGFCEWAGGRLPTEAEWEYAARAGTTAARYGNLDAIAWYGDNSGRQRIDSAEISRTDPANFAKRLFDNGDGPHPVGQKLPNAWNLYDMLGNVWQWTADWYTDKYSGNSETDPRGPTSGTLRTLRGGSWSVPPRKVRASNRYGLRPVSHLSGLGLRCVGN